MKGFSSLAVLATLLLGVACNEKVAPELQEGNSSSTVPEVIPPSTYYFEVTNTSSYLLNYKLHKTGSGNYNTACEVKKNVPLSNSLYRDGADPDSDITCFLEAEELALHFGGVNLQVAASANTCEYVAYSPFSFYNRQPGNSSTSLIKVECAGDTVTPADVSGQLGAYVQTDGGFATCTQWVDHSLFATPNDREAFYAQSDEELCRFNYTDGDKEKCDEGVIQVRTYTVDTDPAKLKFTDRTVKCGGKAYNCLAGPIRLLSTSTQNIIMYYDTQRNQAFAEPFTLPPLLTTTLSSGINNDWGNWQYANYRRNLADPNIDYGNGLSVDPVTYQAKFGNQREFNPLLMDRYSNNKKLDGNELIPTATWDFWSYAYNWTTMNKYYKSTPLAAEPFLGHSTRRTNPFYTFYCLDGAYDIKARIRMVIRDWDRSFPDNANLELLSDINLLTNARQDLYNTEEIPDDQDRLNMYNDRDDWDDLISMERTAGAFDSTNTLYAPVSVNANEGPAGGVDITGQTINYTDGFFNPLIFPRTYKSE